jgi:hypothetical protein
MALPTAQLAHNCADAMLARSDWDVPLPAERTVGTKVKNSITSLPVRHPHDAAQESGTYGGQGKAVRRQEAPTALLFEQQGAQYKLIKIKFVASMIAVTRDD